MNQTSRRRFGDFGEQHARRYLEAHGLTFVAANWHCPAGELDLVMRDGVELVFVEVKARRGEAMGRAEEAISSAKARRLFAAAERFILGHPEFEGLIWRIDLVAVTLDGQGIVRRVTHMENAIVTG